MELGRQVLRLGPGLEERVEDVGRPFRQQAPATGEEGVGLEEVRDPAALDVERLVRRPDRVRARPRRVPRG